MYICISCNKEKTVENFYFNKTYNKYFTRCKTCVKEDPNTRDSWLRGKYGITLDTYNSMLESQNGVCAICKKEETKKNTKYLSVDHCHETGVVRGLLCNKCNNGLSNFGEDTELLSNAIKFLSVNFEIKFAH